MQYKIPVQVENADSIIFGLSLKQLIILVIFGAVSYYMFKGLQGSGVGAMAASIPAVMFFSLGLFIVLFKYSEMTFFPFVLNLIRLNINGDERKWEKGVDSFSSIDIGYVIKNIPTTKKKIDLEQKTKKLKSLKDKLNKI